MVCPGCDLLPVQVVPALLYEVYYFQQLLASQAVPSFRFGQSGDSICDHLLLPILLIGQHCLDADSAGICV